MNQCEVLSSIGGLEQEGGHIGVRDDGEREHQDGKPHVRDTEVIDIDQANGDY